MKDKVYQLVISLTKSEQRYFHRYAHQHRQEAPNYWKIYEVMSNMKAWDPALFNEMLQDQPFYTHLAVVKTQLYERLLDALHLFHRENELEEQVKRGLHQVYLLHRRGQQHSARQHLQKQRKLIEKHQLWIFWPELMNLEYLLAERSPTKADEQSWSERYQEGLNYLQESLPVAQLRADLVQLHLQRVRPEQTQLQILEQRLEAIPLGESPANQADYHQAVALLSFMKRDAVAAGQANADLLQVLEELPPHQRSVPERYLSTLYNYLIDQLQLNNTEAFREGLEKLRQLPRRKAFRIIRGIDAKIFEWSLQLELNHLVQNRNYAAAQSLLPRLEEGLKDYHNKLAPQAVAGLRHLGGLVAFLNGYAERALDFITPLYQESRPSVAHEIYHYAELLYILCHFELQHDQLLEHLMTNFQRRIRNKKDHFTHSWSSLQYIKALQSTFSRSGRQELWQNWLDDLPKPGSAILIYLHLDHWIGQQLARK